MKARELGDKLRKTKITSSSLADKIDFYYINGNMKQDFLY